MTLSIIIATRNRARVLKSTLRSLFGQIQKGEKDVEILLIDNHSTDDTGRVADVLARECPCPFLYLFEDRIGKTIALNTAIKAARGEYIAFIDDDIIFGRQWLSNALNIAGERRVPAVGGRVLPEYGEDTPGWIKDNRDLLDGPIVCHDYGPENKVYVPGMLPFLGANMIVKRDILDEVGLFREDLGPGQRTFGDDTELFRRIEKAGHAIEYRGDLTVHHPVDQSRMSYGYIARWNMAHGKYRALVEDPQSDGRLICYFGVPRYLCKVLIICILKLPLKMLQNQKKFLESWIEFNLTFGMMLGYYKMNRNFTKSSKEDYQKRHQFLSILFLCRTYHQLRGGVESYTSQLTRELGKLGHNVHILVDSKEKKYFLNNEAENVLIHDVDFNESLFPGCWRINKYFPLSELRYSWAAYMKAKELNKIYHFNVVESADWGMESFWILLKRLCPVVVRIHGHHGVKEKFENGLIRKTLIRKLKWHMHRMILNRAKIICPVSRSFGNLALKIWEIKNQNILQVYPGIDPKFFCSQRKSHPGLVLTFVGRIQESKGIGVLMRALPSLLNEFPELAINIIGKDTVVDKGGGTWVEIIRKECPSKRISVLGEIPLEKVRDIYQESDLCIFPSLYEPLGLVAMESMSCGCATIASRTGGLAELINDGVDGLLVPPGNSQELEAAIRRLISDSQLRYALSRNGIRKANAEFSLHASAKKMIEVYLQAINRGVLSLRV